MSDFEISDKELTGLKGKVAIITGTQTELKLFVRVKLTLSQVVRPV